MSNKPVLSHEELLRQFREQHPELKEEYELENLKRELGRVAWQAFQRSRLTKTELARRMRTSIAAVDRLFNAGNGGSCTATTLFKFERATGERIFAHRKCPQCEEVLQALFVVAIGRWDNVPTARRVVRGSADPVLPQQFAA